MACTATTSMRPSSPRARIRIRLHRPLRHYNHYDTGPIILQKKVPVLPHDTPDSLAARVFTAECLAYPEAIRQFAAGIALFNFPIEPTQSGANYAQWHFTELPMNADERRQNLKTTFPIGVHPRSSAVPLVPPLT